MLFRALLEEEKADEVCRLWQRCEAGDGIPLRLLGLRPGAAYRCDGDLQRRLRARVVAVGFFLQLLLRLHPGERGDGLVVDDGVVRVVALALGKVGECVGFQVLLGDDIIDKPFAFRESGGMELPGKDDRQRLLKAEEIWEPRCPAPCREYAELRFRQADFRRGRVAGDAPIAGKGEFVSAADAGAVDGGDGGKREIGDAVEKRLAGGDQAVEALAACGRKLLEIGSGDEDVRLRGADQQAGDIRLLRKLIETLRQLGERGGIEDVRRRALAVEDEDGGGVGEGEGDVHKL